MNTGACGTHTIRCLAKYGITKEPSAVHLFVLDTSVPTLVWVVSVGLGWQAFEPLQIVGFVLIVLGNLILKDILTGKDNYYQQWKVSSHLQFLFLALSGESYYTILS